MSLEESVEESYWAALDLGSNSFHLLLVKPYRGSFEVVERLKEKVQLFADFRSGHLSDAAQVRGRGCLARFAQRLESLPRSHVRMVGTCALRQAQNREGFCREARRLLGVDVDVISGTQEAQLIYLAVVHHLPAGTGRRLVVDIGGGSTELALGSGADVAAALSVDIGCVGMMDQLFSGQVRLGHSFRAACEEAERTIKHALETTATGSAWHAARDVDVFGTSGTIESVQGVLAANGWEEAITAEGLEWLKNAIAEDRWVIDAGVPGLAPDRTDIFAPGVAILSGLFAALGLETMTFVDVSLMQGVICDAIVDDVERDVSQDTVDRLAQKFAVDRRQAQRVERRCMSLYAQSDAWWAQDEECKRMLAWAAQIHEIGVHINPRHYHRHGAYIVKQSDLPGLNRTQKEILSLLIRGHRRSVPALAFQAFPEPLAGLLKRMLALLRLAAIIERGHVDDPAQVSLAVDGSVMQLGFPPGWLKRHQLSARELDVEMRQLKGVGLDLSIVDG